MNEGKARKYIQNRKHWCWATACKIVGERYKRLHTNYQFDIVSSNPQRCGQVTFFEYENGVETDDLEGINWRLQGSNGVRVDAWQRAIVMNANTQKYIGYDGDVTGDDEAKVRGIKYYLTGDIYSNMIDVETIGFYDDETSLLDIYRDRMFDSFRKKEYMIGNAVLQGNMQYHSFVILCIEGEKVMLYDTTTGNILYYGIREVFYDGFRTCSGIGIIKWIQRIV